MICAPEKAVSYWLSSYNEWKMELIRLHEQYNRLTGLTSHLELVPSHAMGNVSDPVVRDVLRRNQIIQQDLPLLQARIRFLEQAMQGLSEEEKTFVSYCLQQVLPSAIRRRMQWSRSTYFKRRREILLKLFHLVGNDDHILIWFPLPVKSQRAPLQEK